MLSHKFQGNGCRTVQGKYGNYKFSVSRSVGLRYLLYFWARRITSWSKKAKPKS